MSTEQGPGVPFDFTGAITNSIPLTAAEKAAISDANAKALADCSTASARIANLLSYGDGQSASSPPDVRLTSFIKSENPSGAACSSSNQCYLSPSTESSTYSSGSGQLQGTTRSTSSLIVSHDALGRRTAEYDSFDTTRSRRDYTYLPNGQLGSISGQTWLGTAYSVQVRYDESGRPITIAASDLYELYWDDADRLIAASITFPAARGAAGYVAARWHYHWLGRQLIAATRELITEFQTVDVKRFWAVSDERGFVYRLLDEQAATFWRARWAATGWRTFVGTPQSEVWVPFALPGQVLLGRSRIGIGTGTGWSEGTEAFASGSGGIWTRPPIAMNRWRAHDPLAGAFLQQDPADTEARLRPEGYLYGRADYPSNFDVSGAKSAVIGGISFEDNCSDTDQFKIVSAALSVMDDMLKCSKGQCQVMPESYKRRWVSTMLTALYGCPKQNENWSNMVAYDAAVDEKGYLYWPRDPSRGLAGAYDSNVSGKNHILLPKAGFSPNPGDPHECLEKIIAHEAMHLNASSDALWLNDVFLTFKPDPRANLTGEEGLIVWTVNECITCR